MTPRTKLFLVIPVIVVVVVALAYYRLFASPVVIAVIFVLWVIISLWNRKRFGNQKNKRASRKEGGRVKAVRA